MKLIGFISFLFIISELCAQNGYEIVGSTFGVPNASGSVCGEVDSCFTLTSDSQNLSGAVWDNKLINLNNNFDATFCLTFGSNNEWGADGIAFVIRGQNTDSIGFLGIGLGAKDINPSIAIEFDTWKNEEPGINDITADHTTLYFNGDFSTEIVGPLTLLPNGGNVEDGQYHKVRIVWNAEQDSLRMYYDGFLRISHKVDLINDVFGGDNLVVWGFTASTGGVSNLQQICFPRYKINLEDKKICDGDTAAISFFTPNMTSYRWAYEDGTIIKDWNTLDYTNPLDLKDTVFYTTQSGMYYLEIAINNQQVKDSMLLEVIPNPIKPFNQDKIVTCLDEAPYMLDALNPGNEYFWSNGDTLQQIEVNLPGLYSVVIKEPLISCSNSDSIIVESICQTEVIFPNVFSPNNDGINDVYELTFSNKFDWLTNFEFKIFNRWGEVIYEVSNEPVKWDGKIGGKEASNGVYIYSYSFQDYFSSELHSGHGYVQIVR